MGYTEYEPIARKYKIPIVVTGFEPLDILQGVYLCAWGFRNSCVLTCKGNFMKRRGATKYLCG